MSSPSPSPFPSNPPPLVLVEVLVLVLVVRKLRLLDANPNLDFRLAGRSALGLEEVNARLGLARGDAAMAWVPVRAGAGVAGVCGVMMPAAEV